MRLNLIAKLCFIKTSIQNQTYELAYDDNYYYYLEKMDQEDLSLDQYLMVFLSLLFHFPFFLLHQVVLNYISIGILLVQDN